MAIAILATVVTAAVAVIALYDKHRAPADEASKLQRRLGLNRKGLVLLALALTSAGLGIGQAISSASSAVEARERAVELKTALDLARAESGTRENELLAKSAQLSEEATRTTAALNDAQSKLGILQKKLDDTIVALDASLASQEQAKKLLESNVAQLTDANREIGALRDQLKALRDAKIRALEADLATALALAKEIDSKAEYIGGRLSEYIMDLRTDPGNMHHAVNDLRNVAREIREKVGAIRKSG